MSDKQIVGVKVWLDKTLLQSTKGSGELLTSLEKLNVNTIIEKLPVDNSIFWTRKSSNLKDTSDQETQHDHILVKIDLDKFLELVTQFSLNEPSIDLINFISGIKKSAQVTQVSLLIPGFKAYFKGLKISGSDSKENENSDDFVTNKKTKSKAKTKTSPKLSKSDLNTAIIHLELTENVSIRSFDTSEELRDLVLSYTKSVSEYLSKHEGAENLIFCDKGVEKSQAKVTKEGQGLVNLWKDLLESFPLVSSDQAQAICAVYPSPLLLKKAYDQSSGSAGMLLADIQVRRGAGVLSSVRRIGPELSQKIHKFFTSNNPDELIVNN